jgi:Na+/H+ antiporter NhaD/arsenite permease-like protein
MSTLIILLVVFFTYVGMAAGRLPWLQVDRTGIALLGVIALLATETATLDDVSAALDTSTLVLLFALMIISAQFISSGFYELCADWITSRRGGPAWLLAMTVAVCGGLAAIIANDILVSAMTPLLIAGARARGLDPRPFVIALAAASNAGSAATVIGNPQNILIGQVGNLSFHSFLFACGVPAVVALLCVFGVVWLRWHDRIQDTVMAVTRDVPDAPRQGFDRNQTMKGLAALGMLLVLFATPLPRDIGGLVIAALLLANRKFTSRTIIAAVDWPLLLLFVCLFAITGTFADKTGVPAAVTAGLEAIGLAPDSLMVLAPLSLAMSNTLGSVPSVILLLQLWPTLPAGALYGLALLSSLAGNLLLVGSLSNLLIVERAATFGVHIGFGEYARSGVPITLLSVAFAVFWLAATGWLPVFPGAGR